MSTTETGTGTIVYAFWPVAQQQLARQLRNAGHSDAAIAERLGRQRQEVTNWFNRGGTVRETTWTPAREAELRRLWAVRDLDAAAIAERILGDAGKRNAVIGKAHRMGLPLRGTPRPQRQGRARTDRTRPRTQSDAAALQPPPLFAETAEEQALRPPAGESPFRSPAPLAANGARGAARPLHARYPATPDFTIHACQWIDGDPKTPDHRFCGAATEPGTPYCPDHLTRATRPAATREPDADAVGIAALAAGAGLRQAAR